MKMNFDFFLPTRVITGRGCVRANAAEFARLGSKCMIITSGSAAKKSGALDDVLAALAEHGVVYQIYDKVRQNPLLTDAYEAAKAAREFGARFVVGIGGGSPLDTAKAVAVYAANDMEMMDIYKPGWKNPALPLVLIGTTAGTGSEVGPFSVLTTPEGRKKSFASEQCYATVMFGDAGYTDSLPLGFTVSTALDALAHAVEGYFSTSGNALSDLYAAEAVRLLVPELTALRGMSDTAQVTPEMRDRLYYASVLAGFTLAKCGTCYCHSLGYFLSEEHGVAHGVACAVYLTGFLRRQVKLLPDKAAQLMKRAECNQAQLCELIGALAPRPQVRLDARQIDELVERDLASANFKRTAPSGFSRDEAVAEVTRLFA